jgi:Rieske Fe-S protein
MGLSVFSALLASCNEQFAPNAVIENDQITLPLNSFEYVAKNQTRFRKHIVIQHDKLRFPICIFRYAEGNFKALLMRCSHQGVELKVNGDRLICPAHGSTFNNQGQVLKAPADKDLRELPLAIEQNNLIIKLKD